MKYEIRKHTFPSPWGKNITAFYRENTNDGGALISCIEQDEYHLQRYNLNGFAVDVGAHIGSVSLALASLGVTVYAVEPIPENMDLLKKNITENHFEDLIIPIEAAISDSHLPSGVFYTGDSTSHGSLHHFIGSSYPQSASTSLYEEGQSIQVRSVTLQDLITRECCLLKLDCEGAEWKVFRSISNGLLDLISLMVGEIHTLNRSQVVSHGDLLPLLHGKFIDVSEQEEPTYCVPGEVTHFVYRKI